MKPYNPVLKPFSRNLRTNMTDAEQLLWSKLRRKQILGLQFYRQKPIANYIVDFYCAAANLVIELDGSQHFEPDHQASDAERDRALESMGIKVLRFDNRQVLTETAAVMSVIFSAVKQIPPSPPFAKGGAGNASELNPTEQEEPISPFFAHCEESSISPFEKTEGSATPFEKVEESISPPLCKRGAGGIFKKRHNMNIQKLLTDHIDIWTAAETEKKTGRGRSSSNAGNVYGIKKLRELILELAVRGKLVSQDASDEPASELLKRIQVEKAKLVAEGKSKSPLTPLLQRGGSKATAANSNTTSAPLVKGGPGGISVDEQPFELPRGWEWTRLDDIGSTFIGLTYSPKDISNTGVPVLRSSNIQNGKIDLIDLVRVDGNIKSSLFVDEGDLLICARNGSKSLVGKTAMIKNLNEPMVFGAFMAIYKSPYNFYVEVFLNSPVFRKFLDGVATTTINQITQNNLKTTLIPIPPLAEQHRIVAKVDELMALCDQLETQHSNAADAHEKLVNHLLGTLTQSLTTASPLCKRGAGGDLDWQRIAEHFDTLFTTEASIDALKQTLLQLAVMGKLVPQDPNDEPASELLKRIQAEKAKLVAEGKIKKDKSLSLISKDEHPFELPPNWEWARFPELGEFGRGKSKHRPRNDPKLFNPGIYPLVQTGEVARAATVIHEYHSKYSEIGLAQSRMWPAGTLCITIAANIADSALLGFDACFPDSVVGFVPFQPLNDTKYFLAFMKTARENLLKFAPATAQKNINLEILESVLIPLPPLKEISRIVAKVDELMTLCEQLKSRITEAKQLQQKLADVLVEQAVSQ